MKYKIKTMHTKILMIFSITMLLLLTVLLLLNGLFMEAFYLKQNKVQFEKVLEEKESQLIHISELVDSSDIQASSENQNEMSQFEGKLPSGQGGQEISDSEPVQMVMDDIRRKTGGAFHFISSELDLFHGNIPAPDSDTLTENLLQVLKAQTMDSEDNSYYLVVEKGSLNEQQMVYAKLLDNGAMVVIIKAMGFVAEASNMFLKFMLITVIIIYVIGFAIIYVIAKMFTKPIIKMKNVTGQMSQLNFTERLIPSGQDEVSQLMESINVMAGELSKNINSLNLTNEQLERELAKEKTLEKMRRRFVSDVSHELKNPLSMILGYADGLVAHIPKTEKDKDEYYKVIVEEAQRMNHLIKDLLDLSSYASGTFTIDKEVFDILDLVKDNLARFEYMSREKEVMTNLMIMDINNREIDEKTVMVDADKVRIGQVILNLMSNAFKNVDESGKIVIEIRQGNPCELIIKNTGKLIPVEELENIWQSFYQLDSTKQGSGLGLAIVKGIINLHQGECSAYIEGAYNCFSVII